MWNAFSKLAQANLDHYDNHQGRHLAITATYAVLATVGATKLAKKINEERPNPYIVK